MVDIFGISRRCYIFPEKEDDKKYDVELISFKNELHFLKLSSSTRFIPVDLSTI
jgi:hypothetical protein